ncbi:MAG: hypothetical protein V4598_10215 [Bdellovibrionota bacterium]
MKLVTTIVFALLSFNALALPEKFTELLPFVQEAPDQGETNTCLYVASTGAMELIANKKNNVRNPQPYGPYDLAESFLIHAPTLNSSGKYYWEVPILKFNRGYGIHINDWPYDAWNNTDASTSAWTFRQWANLPKVELPKVETIPLFVIGNRWSTNVLKQSHLDQVKEALVTHKSPVMINYNDNGYWHVILIVGYNDNIPGYCYELTDKECGERKGAFYVRDSFGIAYELRDYDWFRVKGNAAFIVKEKI